MERELTTKQRLWVWETAKAKYLKDLKRPKFNDRIINGICASLYYAYIDLQNELPENDGMTKYFCNVRKTFPELWEYKPTYIDESGWWWEVDDWMSRCAVYNEIIIKLRTQVKKEEKHEEMRNLISKRILSNSVNTTIRQGGELEKLYKEHARLSRAIHRYLNILYKMSYWDMLIVGKKYKKANLRMKELDIICDGVYNEIKKKDTIYENNLKQTKKLYKNGKRN